MQHVLLVCPGRMNTTVSFSGQLGIGIEKPISLPRRTFGLFIRLNGLRHRTHNTIRSSRQLNRPVPHPPKIWNLPSDRFWQQTAPPVGALQPVCRRKPASKFTQPRRGDETSTDVVRDER